MDKELEVQYLELESCKSKSWNWKAGCPNGWMSEKLDIWKALSPRDGIAEKLVVQKLDVGTAGWTKNQSPKAWCRNGWMNEKSKSKSWMSEWLDERKIKVRKTGCRNGLMKEKSKSKGWMAEKVMAKKVDGWKEGCPKAGSPKAWCPRAGCSPVFSVMKHLMIIDNDSRKASKWNYNWKYPSCRETQNSLLPVNGNGAAAWGQQMTND